jgi:hypothetical protein
MKIVFLSIFLTACSTAPQDRHQRELIQDERPIEVHESVKNYFGVKQ